MTITERLQKYMTFKGLNANNITNDVKLSVGLIGKAIKNNTGLNSETIEKILQTYKDLNPEWLLLENGKMIKSLDQNINDNSNSSKNINSNISGINGNIAIAHNELSNLMEIQKSYQEIQKDLTESLKICQNQLSKSQNQLSESQKQINSLLEILKK